MTKPTSRRTVRRVAAVAVALGCALTFVFVVGILLMSLAHATSATWQIVGAAVTVAVGVTIVACGATAVVLLLRQSGTGSQT